LGRRSGPTSELLWLQGLVRWPPRRCLLALSPRRISTAPSGTMRCALPSTTLGRYQARRPPRRELKARCFSTTHSAVLITTTSTVRVPRPVPPYQPKLAPSCPKLAPHCRPELAPDCPQLAPYCRPKLAPYCPQLAPYCQRCPPTHRSQCRTLRRPQRRLLRHQARQLQRHRTRRRQTRGARVSCSNQNCAATS
jgi:hypothetical protein